MIAAANYLLDVLINLFILILLFWMIFWDCERHHPVRRYLIPRIYGPFTWIGLNVEWTMFTPDPPRHDTWPLAIFTMSDKSIHHWEPRAYLALGIWEKIKYKKLLKFYFQVTAGRADNSIKRDFVEYLLQRHPDGLKCAKVELYCVTKRTMPFEYDGQPAEPDKKLIYTFSPHLAGAQA